jgi:hypothetical protein
MRSGRVRRGITTRFLEAFGGISASPIAFGCLLTHFLFAIFKVPTFSLRSRLRRVGVIIGRHRQMMVSLVITVSGLLQIQSLHNGRCRFRLWVIRVSSRIATRKLACKSRACAQGGRGCPRHVRRIKIGPLSGENGRKSGRVLIRTRVSDFTEYGTGQKRDNDDSSVGFMNVEKKCKRRVSVDLCCYRGAASFFCSVLFLIRRVISVMDDLFGGKPDIFYTCATSPPTCKSPGSLTQHRRFRTLGL